MNKTAVVPVFLLTAVIMIGLNSRSPLTAVPPVIDLVRRDLGISATVAGLLTSIPALCFGLLTPVASVLISRKGVNIAIYITLIGAAIGLVLRPYTGLAGMLGGTLLVGLALAIGNIASLVVISRDFAASKGIVTASYTASMNIGTMLTGSLTAPLALVLGWQNALASWVWLPLVALLIWVMAYRTPAGGDAPAVLPDPGKAEGMGFIWRRPILWLITAGFALHLFIYYALTAWLPAYLRDAANMSAQQAGFIASLMQILSLIGSFGVPVLCRFFSLGAQFVVMGLLWVMTAVIVAVWPQGWLLWSLAGGIAQGGTFVLLFLSIIRYSKDLTENRYISTISQGIGYSVSALGPIVVGYLHEAFSWSAAFGAIAVMAILLSLSGFAMMRIPQPQES